MSNPAMFNAANVLADISVISTTPIAFSRMLEVDDAKESLVAL